MDRFRNNQHRPDWWLAFLTVGLAAFGCAMILSASAYLAATSGDIYAFVTKQLISFGIGCVALLIFTQLDYHIWKRLAVPIFALIIFSLLIVFILPECRGVHRCIDIGPLRFQPAEFVKAGFLIYLAAWFSTLGPKIRDFREGFVPFALLVGVVGGLILLEPDMGTSSTLIFSSAILFFLAGAALRHLGLGIVAGGFLLFILILVAPYRLDRLQTFLHPEQDPQGIGYHVNQVGIAIGSGGLWGLGFGQGKLKYLGYVPEVHTDSIFAVVVEELGFVRAMVVIGAFLLLIYRGFRIAKAAPDQFGRLLAGGLTSLIFIQAAINLAAMLGLMPLTGIPLPLVSYGGSSLVVTLAAVGIILSVSKQTELQEARSKN